MHMEAEMNIRIVALLALTVPFLALTGVALVQHGFLGILGVAWADTASAQVFADLGIALLLLFTFIRDDANERGLAWWPWFVAMPFLGSIAPLGYFFWRELAGARAGGRAEPAA
jgi:hypothetical protein